MFTYSLFLHIFYDLLELHAFLAWDYSDILFRSFFFSYDSYVLGLCIYYLCCSLYRQQQKISLIFFCCFVCSGWQQKMIKQ